MPNPALFEDLLETSNRYTSFLGAIWSSTYRDRWRQQRRALQPAIHATLEIGGGRQPRAAVFPALRRQLVPVFPAPGDSANELKLRVVIAQSLHQVRGRNVASSGTNKGVAPTAFRTTSEGE
ncbi:hypothetical protein [Caballeronia cordobensis]|uniref:hypothetical protein n=1 Tax=Caballeronia cordobensis TaxID=1353886 RepID=UPI00128F3514|nr:hypothetical protein [Caballeronia cordobensis]